MVIWGRSALVEYWEVLWGIQPCRGREDCEAMAALLYDNLPLCVDCAELLLERQQAMAVDPRIRDMLPGVWEP